MYADAKTKNKSQINLYFLINKNNRDVVYPLGQGASKGAAN